MRFTVGANWLIPPFTRVALYPVVLDELRRMCLHHGLQPNWATLVDYSGADNVHLEVTAEN